VVQWVVDAEGEAKYELTSERMPKCVASARYISARPSCGDCDREDGMAQQIKNVVLVHGAFADGSGWEPVVTLHEILRLGRFFAFAAGNSETRDDGQTRSADGPTTGSLDHCARRS
jgi:hypothetical protein